MCLQIPNLWACLEAFVEHLKLNNVLLVNTIIRRMEAKLEGRWRCRACLLKLFFALTRILRSDVAESCQNLALICLSICIMHRNCYTSRLHDFVVIVKARNILRTISLLLSSIVEGSYSTGITAKAIDDIHCRCCFTLIACLIVELTM